MVWNIDKVVIGLGGILVFAFAFFLLFLILKRKKKIVEQKKRILSEENVHKEQIPLEEEEREESLKELNRLVCISKQMESYRIFTQIFQEIARPLQYLLGLSVIWEDNGKEPIEPWADHQILCGVLKRNVISAWELAVQKYDVELRQGRFFVDLPKECKASEMIWKGTDTWTEVEISRMIRQYQVEISEQEKRLLYKELVEELGAVWEILHTQETASIYTKENVQKAASQAKQILEHYGIYPMFYQDTRIEENKSVRARFVRVGEERLRYPSLLVWNQDKQTYEQYGAFAGTCGRERQ